MKIAEIIEKLENELDLISLVGIAKDFFEENKNYIDISMCFSDVFVEFADAQIDIYNSDLLEWAKYHYNEIEQTNEEFGQSSDIIKQIQNAQFYFYNNKLYKEFRNICKSLGLHYSINQLKELYEENQEFDFDEEIIDDLIYDFENIEIDDNMDTICDKFNEFNEFNERLKGE